MLWANNYYSYSSHDTSGATFVTGLVYTPFFVLKVTTRTRPSLLDRCQWSLRSATAWVPCHLHYHISPAQVLAGTLPLGIASEADQIPPMSHQSTQRLAGELEHPSIPVVSRLTMGKLDTKLVYAHNITTLFTRKYTRVYKVVTSCTLIACCLWFVSLHNLIERLGMYQIENFIVSTDLIITCVLDTWQIGN